MPFFRFKTWLKNEKGCENTPCNLHGLACLATALSPLPLYTVRCQINGL